jgi:ankyrin repeat protein
MDRQFKKKRYNKKVFLFLVLNYSIQVIHGLDPVQAKKYAVLSFLKNRILQSLLFQASESGDVLTIIDTVKRNVSLNIKNQQGQTPLIIAVIYGHQAAVEALIFAGASLSITDATGKTALDYALNYHNKTIRNLLLQN